MPIKPWGYDLNPLSPTYGLQKQADDGSALIGPPPASPSNVMLACLSDPFFNNTQWYAAQFISVDSMNKSYSTGFWSNIGSYTPSAASETISRFTVHLSAGVSTATNISVWVRPLGGAEYDTGIVIALSGGDAFKQNTVDTIVLNAGDEIKFTTDTFIWVQNIMIYATRQ